MHSRVLRHERACRSIGFMRAWSLLIVASLVMACQGYPRMAGDCATLADDVGEVCLGQQVWWCSKFLLFMGLYRNA